MKLYLSSYELGDDPAGLVALYGANKRVGYVPNARDFTTADAERKLKRTENDMAGLASLGLMPELVDLSEYFGHAEKLAERLAELGGLWVSGGNVFVLRQAMRLSGFEDLLPRLLAREDFVYGGYSAAGCVLTSDLRVHAITDDATDLPYPEIRETIWE
jgi:dipeptidase E